jgi:hypothetical protein
MHLGLETRATRLEPRAQTTKPRFVVWAPFILTFSPFAPSDSLSCCHGSCARLGRHWQDGVCAYDK